MSTSLVFTNCSYFFLAASEYFKSMFANNTKENNENRIEMPDFEHGVVKEMLRYLYSRKIENLSGLAGGLLIIADKV